MSNLLTSPRFFRKKAILAKAENAVGTDAVPTGTANWIEARNVTLTPYDVETDDRGLEMPYMGNSGKIIAGQWVKLAFETALAGPGAAGSAPKISPLLLACGTAETLVAATSAAYNLVSSAFGAASFYIIVDGVRHKMIAARGDMSLTYSAKKGPRLKFDFEAAYLAPDTLAMPAIDRSGWPLEEAVSAAATLPIGVGGTALAFSQLDFKLGNKLSRINLPGPQTGIEIVDRAPTLSATVLAPGLAAFDPFALASAGSVLAVTTTHGSAAGKKAKIDVNARIVGVEYDKIEEMAAYKLTLEPVPVGGNDEFALTYL